MTTWPGYYDVVILPPPDLRDYSIALSRKLDGRWVLGKRAYLPHISLYHIPVRDEDFAAFAAEVSRIEAATRWGWLETMGFDRALLMLDKPEWIVRLHREVVRRTAPYFNWKYRPERTWRLDYFSGRRRVFAKKYLREYGTPMYGMNFRPHITLSASEPGVDLPFKKFRFRPADLNVCLLGESHTCHLLQPDTDA